MKAIVITDQKLELRDVSVPEPGYGQARVRVRAAGVNRPDVLQVMGLYPAPPDAPPDIPGLEVAGEVDAVGPGVTNVRAGDRVFAVVSGGGYAESVVVHARTLAPLPDGISYTDAAAIPEAFVTAYDAMVLQAGLAAGETVLVTAAASGVGTAALQIARAIGARPIGTTRTDAKMERLRSIGLETGIVAKDGAYADAVRGATGGRGADVVLELVAGGYLSESLRAMDAKGRLVLAGLLGGPRADVDLALVLRNRLRIYGTVLRPRPLEEKILAAGVLARNIAPLLASGAVRAIVDQVLPLEKAAEAHSLLTSNATFGKIVLTT